MSPAENQISAPPALEITRLAEHLFRHEAGKLVSVLTRIFGIDRLQMAEDVVQEALVRALRTWPYYGIPKNPAAWLTLTAKHLALDLLRREKVFHDKRPQIAASIETVVASESPTLETEIKDDRLRLMFACCHPLIPRDAQAPLALKTLCGFSNAEIAKAFLTSEAAIAKRLTRVRQKIRAARIPLEIPAGEELSIRLEGVQQTLYLLFNEGYKASSGERLIKEDLCHEAIRLATLLVEHPAGNLPRTHALLALMWLDAARLPARVDSEGQILLLANQDRSTWDRSRIARGLVHLSQAAGGQTVSEYHLQAGIAACHCAATDYAATDWLRILSLYDRWLEIDHTPVIALNRAVAVAKVHGPKAGLEAVRCIRDRRPLESYYLFYAVLAEFERQLGDFTTAVRHLRQALRLTEVASEKSLLLQRLSDCEAHGISGNASREGAKARI